jgi:hypothetical protein
MEHWFCGFLRLPTMHARSLGSRSSGITFTRFFVLNTMWTWLLTYELGIVSSLRDSFLNLMLPGTPVPGSRLFRPFGTLGLPT